MRWLRSLFITLTLCLVAGTGAAQQAQHRLALVIGNAAYNPGRTPADSRRLVESEGYFQNLAKPINDADDVEASLKRLGFSVLPVRNGDLARMRDAIHFFGERLRQLGPQTIAVVYFSGHGFQADGANMLVPVGARLQASDLAGLSAGDRAGVLRSQVVPLSDIFAELTSPRGGANIVVLDACRTTPWASLEGAGTGFAAEQPNLSDTIIQYATALGATASDGAPESRNSPYTRALKARLDLGGSSTLERLFGDVARDVREATGGSQVPWTSSGAVPDDVCLGACPSDVSGRPEVGEPFEDCPGCPRMRTLSGGIFPMGSPGTDRDRNAIAEGMQIRYPTVHPFSVGMYEVTYDQYDACVRDGQCPPPQAAEGNVGTHPVVGVTWANAQSYVRWLSARTGRSYRLLTETEWEFAARGGSVGKYSNDGAEADLCAIANHRDRSAPPSDYNNMACDDGVASGTAEVGRYAANGFGLFDMQGNAWEWVQDCYSPGYRNVPLDGSAYRPDAADCAYRVDRGGSWDSSRLGLRSADRGYAPPDKPEANIGFRVARSP